MRLVTIGLLLVVACSGKKGVGGNCVTTSDCSSGLFCGSDKTCGQLAVPGPVTPVVSPKSASLYIGQQQAFTANTNVTWQVKEGAAGGSISTSGTYAAPNTPGVYHVVAISGQLTDTATVTVYPALALNPTAFTLAVGGTAVFQTSETPGTVTYAVDPKAGSFTGDTFTAATTPGHYTVTASMVFAPSVTVPASLDITPVLSSVSPLEAKPSSALTMTGAGFGASQGTSTVTFGGTALAVTAWSATSITATLPGSGLQSPLLVTVASEPSNALSVYVAWAATLPFTASVQASNAVQLASDGDGGAFIAQVSSTNIYFEHVTRAGVLDTTTANLSTTKAVSYFSFVSDGSGGALIAYVDDVNVIVRSLSKTVSLGLTTSPVLIGTGPSGVYVTSDGSGGAYVGMKDNATAIFQHVGADGTPTLLTSGITATTPSSTTLPLALVPSAGAAIAVLQGDDSGTYSFYAMEINNVGALSPAVTMASGVSLQGTPLAVSDGAGGAYVSWLDGASPPYSVAAQRILVDASLPWGTSAKTYTLTGYAMPVGASLSFATAAPNQNLQLLVRDFEEPLSYPLIARQVNGSDGSLAWTSLASLTNSEYAEDFTGCATVQDDFVAGWINGAPPGQVLADRVTSDATTPWTPLQQSIEDNASITHSDLQMVCDDAGGAILAWINGNDAKVYITGIGPLASR